MQEDVHILGNFTIYNNPKSSYFYPVKYFSVFILQRLLVQFPSFFFLKMSLFHFIFEADFQCV